VSLISEAQPLSLEQNAILPYYHMFWLYARNSKLYKTAIIIIIIIIII